MFAYVLIALAVVCFAAQFAFTKLFECTLTQNSLTALVMLIVTSIIGMVLFLVIGGFRLQISLSSSLWAMAFALVMIPYYILGILVLSLGSLAIYTMFMMLGGLLVPFFYGITFLDETVSVGKGVGAALLTLCIISQALAPPVSEREKSGSKGKRTLFFGLCFLIFLINGMTCVIAKAHQLSAHAIDEASFTVLSCFFTACFSLILMLISSKPQKTKSLQAALKAKPFFIMTVLGAAAHTGNYLHLLVAESIPASIQFPMVSGGVIVLSAFVSVFVFKEKLSKQEWLCISGAFLSTFLFAF